MDRDVCICGARCAPALGMYRKSADDRDYMPSQQQNICPEHRVFACEGKGKQT
jgi:hypothetical protein